MAGHPHFIQQTSPQQVGDSRLFHRRSIQHGRFILWTVHHSSIHPTAPKVPSFSSQQWMHFLADNHMDIFPIIITVCHILYWTIYWRRLQPNITVIVMNRPATLV